MVDRFDVRNLLDDEQLFVAPKKRKSLKGSFSHEDLQEEKLCDEERYRDLYLSMMTESDQNSDEELQPTLTEEQKRENALQEGGFHAVGFQYIHVPEEKQEDDKKPASQWNPPFPVPKGITLVYSSPLWCNNLLSHHQRNITMWCCELSSSSCLKINLIKQNCFCGSSNQIMPILISWNSSLQCIPISNLSRYRLLHHFILSEKSLPNIIMDGSYQRQKRR